MSGKTTDNKYKFYIVRGVDNNDWIRPSVPTTRFNQDVTINKIYLGCPNKHDITRVSKI